VRKLPHPDATLAFLYISRYAFSKNSELHPHPQSRGGSTGSFWSIMANMRHRRHYYLKVAGEKECPVEFFVTHDTSNETKRYR
jgi:hypothetical protein